MATLVEPPAVNRTKGRILIVDDELVVRDSLGKWFNSEGYTARPANGAREALEFIQQSEYDIALIDIKMPGMDGITAARELTKERIAPVLLLTAFSEQELVERARDAGVVAYLVKPFREAELLPSVEIALARFAEFQMVEKEVHSLKDALETRKVVEQAKGVLMESQGLKEAEAFHRIRKASMDTRKSMREIAEAILLTHQLEKSS